MVSSESAMTTPFWRIGQPGNLPFWRFQRCLNKAFK
jgi:hypothetical protein